MGSGACTSPVEVGAAAVEVGAAPLEGGALPAGEDGPAVGAAPPDAPLVGTPAEGGGADEPGVAVMVAAGAVVGAGVGAACANAKRPGAKAAVTRANRTGARWNERDIVAPRKARIRASLRGSRRFASCGPCANPTFEIGL